MGRLDKEEVFSEKLPPLKRDWLGRLICPKCNTLIGHEGGNGFYCKDCDFWHFEPLNSRIYFQIEQIYFLWVFWLPVLLFFQFCLMFVSVVFNIGLKNIYKGFCKLKRLKKE